MTRLQSLPPTQLLEVLGIDGREISKKENVSIAEGITLDVSGTPQRFERSKDMRTQEEKDNLLRGVSDLFSM